MNESKGNGNKQLAATVTAVVLGVAGTAGWFKPTDNTAAVKAYEATKTAIEVNRTTHHNDIADLHDRHRDFETWVARRLAEIDRDSFYNNPKVSDEDLEDEPQWQPPPHERKRPMSKAKPLPNADEFIE